MPDLIKIKLFDPLTTHPGIQSIIGALPSSAQLYLVGGAVRDLLLGIYRGDIDLACNLPPEQTSQILQDAGLKIVPTGIHHGTITVVFNREHVEITTFRAPSSRLKTEYSQTIEQDLCGRDFTINALAFDFARRTIIDPFGGQEDLESMTLKCVGDPNDRFTEDPLRILRMIRFGPGQGRKIEIQTAQAATTHAALLNKISVERIREEICKLLVSEKPAEALRSVKNYELLPYILPELIPAVGCEQNKWHIHDVFEHTLAVIERTPPEILLRLTALFHDIGKPATVSVGDDGERHFYRHEHIGADICKDAMQRLKFSNESIKSTSTLVEYHMRPLACTESAIRRLIRDLGPLLMSWQKFKWADKSPTVAQAVFDLEAAEFNTKLELELARQDRQARSQLAVDGHTLMQELNMAPGPPLGKIIKALKELILDNPELNEPATLIYKARKLKDVS
jgi:tRNA nucleotidyltransferase (CCA-adding enzyme)